MQRKATIVRFDPDLRAADANLKHAIAEFAGDLEAREAEQRTRRRRDTDRAKLHVAIEVMLCNMIAAYAIAPSAVIAVPLSNAVLRGSPRYRPIAFGKHFHDLVTLMEDKDLIQVVTRGGLYVAHGRRELTTIRPTAALTAVFPLITLGVPPHAIVGIDPKEAIELRDAEKKRIAYVDTVETNVWREELRAINAYLRNADIKLTAKHLVDERGLTIHAGSRTLRRIFNGSWEHGGRLYGAVSWQVMPRDLRLHAISIGGEPIANVDFKQFNLRLAYALADVTPPEGDLYDLTGHDTAGPNWAALREGRKKLTNMMFNLAKPLTRWPGKTSDERKAVAACFPQSTTPASAAADIRAAHSAIAIYFESASGLHFMRIEADILVATVLSLMEQGITALPLHDAVLVQERHAEPAKETMERESKRRVGTTIPAEITTVQG